MIFAPDEYEYIYNTTITQNMHMIDDDQDDQYIKINKLLHKVLDDASEVITFVRKSISIALKQK